ncbi:MAG: VanZ family protein [Myxococcota bacterium]|jgi:VanZ family protein
MNAGEAKTGIVRLLAVYWLPVLMYLWLILWFSSRSWDLVPGLWRYDKLPHFLEFMGMAVLASRAMRRTIPLAAWEIVVLTGVFGFLFGTLDEYWQSFVPGRTADMMDAITDGAGALAGAVVYAAMKAAMGRRGGAGK